MKTTFVWLKLILLSAFIAVAVFYAPEQKQGWYGLVFVGAAYLFVDGMEKRAGQKALAALYANKAESYRWLQQNLSGSRIRDLKLIRRRFNLPLASAVKVLDEYLASERSTD